MKSLILSMIATFTVLTTADELKETIETPKPAAFLVQLETAALWQTRNTFRLPGRTGSEVRLADFKSGPFFSYRLNGEWKINERHAIRLLFAPLSYSVSFTPSTPLSIAGKTFSAGTALTTRYQFNSYRATYRYTFLSDSPLKWRLGFTVKIRDANIETTDGAQTADDPNLGFVPLLHFGARWDFDEGWFADFDADALAAPQGRAEDVALRFGRVLSQWELALGYRFLEGGADNNNVFTFAYLHYLFASITYGF